MFKSFSLALLLVVFVGTCYCNIAQDNAKNQKSPNEIQNGAQKSQDSHPKQQMSQNSQSSPKQANDAQATAVLSHNTQPSSSPAKDSHTIVQQDQNSQKADAPSDKAAAAAQQDQNAKEAAPGENQAAQEGQNSQQAAAAPKDADNAQLSAPVSTSNDQGQDSQKDAASPKQGALSKVLLRQNSQPSGAANDAQQIQPNKVDQQQLTFNNAALKMEAKKQVKQLLIKKSTSNDAGVEKCLGRYKMNVGAAVRCEQPHPQEAVKCSPYNKQLVLTPFPGAMPKVVDNSAEECASRASCCALVAEAYNSVTEFCGCKATAPPPLEKEN